MPRFVGRSISNSEAQSTNKSMVPGANTTRLNDVIVNDDGSVDVSGEHDYNADDSVESG